MNAKRYLSVNEVAERLGVCRGTLYNLESRGVLRRRVIAQGKVRALKRYYLKDIEEFERLRPMAR